jgi:hypothetical protein
VEKFRPKSGHPATRPRRQEKFVGWNLENRWFFLPTSCTRRSMLQKGRFFSCSPPCFVQWKKSFVGPCKFSTLPYLGWRLDVFLPCVSFPKSNAGTNPTIMLYLHCNCIYKNALTYRNTGVVVVNSDVLVSVSILFWWNL